MPRHLGLVLPLLFGLVAGPALAQVADGIDNDNDGQIDEPDEYDGGSYSSDRMEAECLATGRLEICVAYHQFACQNLGFTAACQLAQMGQNCYGGDPGQCQYYLGLLQANTACYMGDPRACGYLQQQGFGG